MGSAYADDGRFVDRVARAATVGDVGVDMEVGRVAVPRERVDVGERLKMAAPIRQAEYRQQHGRHQPGCGQEPYCRARLIKLKARTGKDTPYAHATLNGRPALGGQCLPKKRLSPALRCPS